MNKITQFLFQRFENFLAKKKLRIISPFEDMTLCYEHYEECSEDIEIIKSNTMVVQPGLRNLYEQAIFCEQNHIEGDFVECGVWKGGAIGLIALANLRFSPKRRHIHLFDSFQDICEPDEKVDGSRAIHEVKSWSNHQIEVKGRLKPIEGFYDQLGGHGTMEECKELLEGQIGYTSTFLHYHKGWFQDTLPQAHKSIEKIAILRIDADWHASTKVCLEYLYDKVIPGGFVIIDDYGAYEGCKKAVDDFLKSRTENIFLNYVNKEIRYLIKP